MNARARGKAVTGFLPTPFTCHLSVTSHDVLQIDSLFAGYDWSKVKFNKCKLDYAPGNQYHTNYIAIPQQRNFQPSNLPLF